MINANMNEGFSTENGALRPSWRSWPVSQTILTDCRPLRPAAAGHRGYAWHRAALGCTTTRIAQMVREGTIPKVVSCPAAATGGSGNSTAAKWKNGLPNGRLRGLPDVYIVYTRTSGVRMGRKRKLDKQTITVVVNGTAIPVILHPPVPPRSSWYAYWPGLGREPFHRPERLRGGRPRCAGHAWEWGETGNAGRCCPHPTKNLRRFNGGTTVRKRTPDAQLRAQKSLKGCLDAISAFRQVTGITPIALATPDDCE